MLSKEGRVEDCLESTGVEGTACGALLLKPHFFKGVRPRDLVWHEAVAMAPACDGLNGSELLVHGACGYLGRIGMFTAPLAQLR